MARVPVSRGNEIALQPMGARRLEAQDFSAGVREAASAAAGFGAAMVRFGEEQDQLQAQMDEAAAKAIDNDYAEYEREVLHTGDAAFYKLEGFTAANARETVQKQLDARRQELIARAANARQRAMAGDALERRFGASVQGIATYANRQLRVEETRQSARRAATAADDAVLYFKEPERFGQEIAVGEAEIRTELSKQGAAPETIRDEVSRYRSGIYKRVGDGMIDRLEIDAAIGFMRDNRGNMTEADAAALDRSLARPLVERKIDGLADYIMGEGRPVAEQGAEPVGDPDQLAKGFALPMPVEGPITSGFGRRRAPKLGASINHTAIDIAAPVGTPIRAQAAGRVVSAKEEGNAGLVVRVDYGNGVEASYAHMQGFKVREGTIVKPGQELGGVGMTGNTTGPHVHYSLRVNGTLVDPSKFAGVTGRPSGGQRAPTTRPGAMDRETAMARIDELNLPLEEKQLLQHEVSNRFAQDRAIINDREERARDQALTILNRADAAGTPLTRESAIPGAVWDSLSPSDAMAIRNDIRRNAGGGEAATDMGTFLQLSDLYAVSPEQFAKLNPADYLGKLSKQDFEQVFGTWRRDAIKGMREGASTSQVTHERIRTIMSPALSAAGLTTTGIPEKDKEARTAMANRIYRAQKAVQAEVSLYQRENPGKQVPDDLIRSIVDRQLTPTRARSDAPERGTFFGIGSNTPTFVPWFERQSLGTRQFTVQVPRADRDRLARLGRQVLGREPTAEEISRAYFEEVRR